MAITVKHSKVSTIPDGDDTSVVRPSDWNADHTLTGTIPVANGGTGASTLTGYVYGNGTSAMTAATTIPNTSITGLGTASTKDSGVANGVATLDGSGTVPISQLPAAVLGALSYQGTWNASTNTPTLTSSVGTKGYYYVVSVAGSTNLNGITDWQVGDWAVYNGTAWQKIDNTDAVTSVNGYTGTVVLTTTDVAEGTNQYFTTARARTSVSAGTGISYNNTTGVITNSSPSLGGDVVGPTSATDNAVARFDTTTGKLIQNSVTLIDDTGNASGILSQQFSNGSAVTLAAGKMWYDGSTGAWNAGMGGGNITQQIGEELFIYGKASAAITDSPLQIVYHTGTVGASGVITFAPTIAGITDENAIIGVATESLALNGFGRVTSFGVVRGITTNGTAFGETWADDDVIWYNPVTGNPTNVKPSAPNIKFQIGLVIKAGAGGSGSFQVALVQGTALGGTDSNVKLNGVTNGQIISYDGGNGYWKNTDLTAGTGISVSKSTNGVLTVTNTSPSSGGTVTSVAATVPSFLSVTGSPITNSGTLALSYSGTALPILNGGTGQTTANAAFNALAPSQTSNSGKYLTSNGTDTSWASLGNAYSRTSFAATAAQTTFTVAYTVGLIQVYVNGVLLNGDDYTATNGTSVVLAVACNSGDIVEALAFSSFSVASTVSSFSAGTTGLTPSTGTTGNVTLGGTLAVANGGTGVTTKTGTGNVVLSTSPTLTTPALAGATSGNITLSAADVAGTNTITFPANTGTVVLSYATSYLIIGGGGGAGVSFGAGGGGGGVVSGTTQLITGVVYSATIGAGGAPQTQTTGGNSSLTGLTIAIGGGCGGGITYPTGTAGGSGGGGRGSSSAAGGAGTSGQGFAGGTGNTTSAGGGGGAGGVGVSPSGTQGGAGGIGIASSITGTSIYYAGGGSGNGSGGTQAPQSGGTAQGVAGAANTGAGAGGDLSVAGGSGVVILSVPSANYSGVITGSPTVTTSGSNTIIKFTSSGTYKA